MCLTYLPAAIRDAVHFASCAHVASVLLRALLGARPEPSQRANGSPLRVAKTASPSTTPHCHLPRRAPHAMSTTSQ